jgi:translation initiation factor 2 subunit 2
MLHSHNPELAGDKKKLTLVPPQVTREGPKKTMFANLAEICRRMHRQPKHLMEFLFAELGTSGSVDAQQRLIIKGRYTQKSMENVLRRYIGGCLDVTAVWVNGTFVDQLNRFIAPIVEYVVCKTCKSPDTLLNKENRLYFITCESCGSRESTHAHLLLSLASSPLIDTFHLFPGRSVAAIKTGFQAQVGRRIKPAA